MGAIPLQSLQNLKQSRTLGWGKMLSIVHPLVYMWLKTYVTLKVHEVWSIPQYPTIFDSTTHM